MLSELLTRASESQYFEKRSLVVSTASACEKMVRVNFVHGADGGCPCPPKLTRIKRSATCSAKPVVLNTDRQERGRPGETMT